MRSSPLQVVHTIADAHSCNATIQWTKIPYIPVVNSPPMVSLLETVAKRFGEYGSWQRMEEPLMVGEDFAFLAGRCQHQCSCRCASDLDELLSCHSAKSELHPDAY